MSDEKKELEQPVSEPEAGDVRFVQASILPGVLTLSQFPAEDDSEAISRIAFGLGRGYRRVGDFYVIARLYSDYPHSYAEPQNWSERLISQINDKFASSTAPLPCIGLIESKDTIHRMKAEIIPVPYEAPNKIMSHTMFSYNRTCLGLHRDQVQLLPLILEYMGSRRIPFELLNGIEARFKYNEHFSEYLFAKVALRDIADNFAEVYQGWEKAYIQGYLDKMTAENPFPHVSGKRTLIHPCPSIPIYCFIARHVLLNPFAWRTPQGKLLCSTIRAIFAAHPDTIETFNTADEAIKRTYQWYCSHVDPSDDMVYETDAVQRVLKEVNTLFPEEREELEGHIEEDKAIAAQVCEKCNETNVFVMKYTHLGEARHWCVVCMMKHFDDLVHENMEEATRDTSPEMKMNVGKLVENYHVAQRKAEQLKTRKQKSLTSFPEEIKEEEEEEEEERDSDCKTTTADKEKPLVNFA